MTKKPSVETPMELGTVTLIIQDQHGTRRVESVPPGTEPPAEPAKE